VQAALEALGKGAASTELDEFGRDPSMARERRMRARAERRKDTAERRRRLRGGAQEEPIGTREQLVEDMWTSDESDSELAEWRKARAELAVQADELFGDVRREFRDLKAIHARMQQWKARFPKSYREAWVAMSLPRLLAPYVRKETVAWEPLNGQTLESLPWVSDLFPADEAAAEASEDDDVIPNLVKEVICPKVAEALRSEWDPSSSGATARAVALLNDVLVFVLDAAPVRPVPTGHAASLTPYSSDTTASVRNSRASSAIAPRPPPPRPLHDTRAVLRRRTPRARSATSCRRR